MATQRALQQPLLAPQGPGGGLRRGALGRDGVLWGDGVLWVPAWHRQPWGASLPGASAWGGTLLLTPWQGYRVQPPASLGSFGNLCRIRTYRWVQLKAGGMQRRTRGSGALAESLQPCSRAHLLQLLQAGQKHRGTRNERFCTSALGVNFIH